MAAVHIAVVAEKHDVGIICKVQFIQRLHQAAHIPVQVAHHGVIPGQLPLGLLGEKLGLQFFDLPLKLGLGLLLRAGGLSAYQG